MKKCNPRKLVEVGVANGGSTALILQVLSDLQPGCQVYSIDKSVFAYRHRKEKSGYLGTKAKEVLGYKNQEFLLGGILPDYLKKIGTDIDFILLDTMHILPGELLDFITILPYLKDGAIVCLHDINLHAWDYSRRNADATCTLFSSAVGEKFINKQDGSFPNIGAIKVNQDTRKYISNVFSALCLPWNYIPSDEDVKKYYKVINEHYCSEYMWLFNQAIQMNKKTLSNISLKDRIKVAGRDFIAKAAKVY